jgi:threonylcarbamoyladenosine tRNA methylthiotransferase MtaB
MKNLAILTLGCKANQADSDKIISLAQLNNFALTSFKEKADVYIVNSCTVTQVADKKTRQMLRRARQLNSRAQVIVTGCGANIPNSKLEELQEFNIKILPHQKLINHLFKSPNHNQAIGFSQKTRANVMIQNGCNDFCTYCIIPFARGREESYPLKEIIEKVAALSNNGTQEVVLTGINIGAYNFKGYDLCDLIQKISQIEGIKRIRISSIEEHHLNHKLINEIATNIKIMPHIHLPLQSASNKILKVMNRKYTTEHFLSKLLFLRQSIPGLKISTDILVGFPGETEKLFEESLTFIEQCNFSHIHSFKYSKREGTPAADMPNQVPETVKKERMQKLAHLESTLKTHHLEESVNKEGSILFEVIENGYWTGYNEYYQKVYVKSAENLANKILMVRPALVKDGILYSEKI